MPMCLKHHINAVTVVIHYFQATEDVQEGLTDDDYDMYYEIWQQFDPDGTQYLRWKENLLCYLLLQD